MMALEDAGKHLWLEGEDRGRVLLEGDERGVRVGEPVAEHLLPPGPPPGLGGEAGELCALGLRHPVEREQLGQVGVADAGGAGLDPAQLRVRPAEVGGHLGERVAALLP